MERNKYVMGHVAKEMCVENSKENVRERDDIQNEENGIITKERFAVNDRENVIFSFVYLHQLIQ